VVLSEGMVLQHSNHLSCLTALKGIHICIARDRAKRAALRFLKRGTS
jgi:hypothetical protein